jgi:hypothetical protein
MHKKTVHYSLILAFTVLTAMPCSGQDVYNYSGKRYNPYLDRFALSIGAGLSAYNGELSTFFQPKLQNYYLNPGLGFSFAYRVLDNVSFKAETNFFTLSSKSEPVAGDSINEIFWSYNLDYFIAGVVDFIPQKRIDAMFSRWNGALSAGIGQVVFSPRDNVAGGKKFGQIISSGATSSQYEYAKLSVIYTLGAAVKYFINKNNYLSLEGTYRFTRTDFLDALKDTSHTPFDRYVTLQFRYTIIFDSTPNGIINYEKYRKIYSPR